MNKEILLNPAGIPYEEVGPRLKELDEALRKCDMAVGAETDIHLTLGPAKDRVMSATITVYLLQKEEPEEKADVPAIHCENCKHFVYARPYNGRCSIAEQCVKGSQWEAKSWSTEQ